MYTSGNEMPNHIAPTDSIVVKGIAPLDRWPQMKKFTNKPSAKITPGYSVAVRNAALFHSYK